jgi:hypothetical protein
MQMTTKKTNPARRRIAKMVAAAETRDTATTAPEGAPDTEAAQEPTPAPSPNTVADAATDARPAAEVATPAGKPRKGRARKAPRTPQPADAAPVPLPASTTGTLTMRELADGYVAALVAAGKGLGTQFSYSIDLAVAVKHFGADTAVADLTERKVLNFFESDAVTKTRSGKAKAKPTIDKTRRVFRLAAIWAGAAGLVPEKYLPRHKPTEELATTD